MSPSCYITERVLKNGRRRWVVRYRTGGRKSPLVHAGSFESEAAARARRMFVYGELAANRDPRVALDERAVVKPKAVTVKTAAANWIRSERAIGSKKPVTVEGYAGMIPTAIDGLEDIPVSEATWEHFQEWVVAHADDYAVATLKQCRTIHRHIFRHAGVRPSPAHDDRIRLPRQTDEEVDAPSAEHVETILDRVPVHHVLPLAVLEQTGMRSGELALTWGDVDEAGCRFRIPAELAKTGRARWVQLPGWLMDAVAATCPREDRVPGRRVFPGTTGPALRSAMRAACKLAGIPHYHPHDLRHRRITIWHHGGVPWKAVADRVGQSKASITMDVYTHVLPVAELSQETWNRILVRSR